ncbi:hypothetical protein [Curtobacterium ammoniigenes]|uniref:hypothetical protein n=1 Tax=Curtobacterium ammoniigenes TaxID=395387 RepID=UPI000831EBA1|nr:hypothetical protein [Curtobacterium ammoniigenes]
MTFTDWSTDLVLLALVLLQLRARKLGVVHLLLPVAIVALAVWYYFSALPTSATGVVLCAFTSTIGLTLGVVAAACTRVWHRAGTTFAQAGPLAALIWIIGMGARLAFQIWAHTSGGAHSLTTFSIQHRLDAVAWVDALLFMAVGQVLARAVVLFIRGLATGRRVLPTAIG